MKISNLENLNHSDSVKAAIVLGKQEQNIGTLSTNWQLISDRASNPAYGFKAGRNEVLPFPKKEVDQNPNIRQNSGF